MRFVELPTREAALGDKRRTGRFSGYPVASRNGVKRFKLCQNDFAGWPNIRLQQVTAMCRAIFLSDYCMSMDDRLSVLLCYIADQG